MREGAGSKPQTTKETWKRANWGLKVLGMFCHGTQKITIVRRCNTDSAIDKAMLGKTGSAELQRSRSSLQKEQQEEETPKKKRL